MGLCGILPWLINYSPKNFLLGQSLNVDSHYDFCKVKELDSSEFFEYNDCIIALDSNKDDASMYHNESNSHCLLNNFQTSMSDLEHYLRSIGSFDVSFYPKNEKI